eukprot:scaffold195392_cov18-Prasinocladus_malaysianus.AAC.3
MAKKVAKSDQTQDITFEHCRGKWNWPYLKLANIDERTRPSEYRPANVKFKLKTMARSKAGVDKIRETRRSRVLHRSLEQGLDLSVRSTRQGLIDK